MSDKSKIEWTDATWNPITGCSVVSPGCTNCYAMKLAGTRLKDHPSRSGLTDDSKAGPVWNGQVRLNEDWLDQPLRWKKPRQIFVCAHGDLFHENVPDEWIDSVFAVMALAPQHSFQVLTKRPDRMQKYVSAGDHEDSDLFERIADAGARMVEDGDLAYSDLIYTQWPLPNVWLGVSAEDQARANERIPHLLETPAAVRFVSAEPLLGPINLKNITPPGGPMDIMLPLAGLTWRVSGSGSRLSGQHAALDWVIAGGESGPGARPMLPDWPRALRDQCQSAGVAFHFKQWGEWLPIGQSLPGCGKVHGATAVKPGRMKLHYGGTSSQPPKHAFADRGVEFAATDDGLLTLRVGKRAAGRLLDGRTWDQFPEVAS
ncbi:DUF5131 family protein [Fodinicurvata fenggangensis]|uniref:DUF5131 family protein n=1 Tax=Fodinicurvata fenggangensis TaxID=1121830 RepID=UPI00047C9E32|nr:phage Gp37/Gp68 family protein [Fodinicurvata fenggangensis]